LGGGKGRKWSDEKRKRYLLFSCMETSPVPRDPGGRRPERGVKGKKKKKGKISYLFRPLRPPAKKVRGRSQARLGKNGLPMPNLNGPGQTGQQSGKRKAPCPHFRVDDALVGYRKGPSTFFI